MPIVVVCPGCGTKLSAPDSAAGKRVRCPKAGCAMAVAVPAAAPAVEAVEPPPPPKPAPKPQRAAAPSDEDEVKRAAMKARGAEEDEDDRPAKRKTRDADDDDRPARSRRRSADDEDDEDDDRPARRRKKPKAAGISPAVIAAIALVGLIVVGGAGYAVYALAFKKDETAGSSSNSTAAAPPAPVLPAGWAEYRSDRDKFKMLMPPQVVTKPSAKGRRYEGRDDPNTLLVMVGAHDLAANMSPEARKAGATLMLEAFRNQPLFKFSAERQVPFAGQTVTEMVLDGPEERNPAGVMQKTQMLVRALLVGNKVYTVVIGGSVTSTANANAIFDTFALLP